MADKRYLTKRRNLWYINYAVPKHLRPVLGTNYLSKTTGTSDLRQARTVRNQFLVEIDKLVAAKTNAEATPSTVLNAKRLIIERFFSGLSPADRKEQADLIIDNLSEKLEHRYGGDVSPSDMPDTDEDKLELVAVQEIIGQQTVYAPDVTLKDGLSDVLEENDTPDTRYRFERSVELFLAHLKRQDLKLKNASRRSVKEFITIQLSTKGKSTVDGYLTCLSEIWRHQVDIENIKGDNPFKGHKVRGEKSTYVPFAKPELTEIMKLITATEDKLMVLIGYYTGMRRGEIWGLRKSDIIEDSGICYFNVEPTSERSVKTINAIRRIPIHSALLDKVLKHIETISDDADTLFSHRPDDDAFGKFFGRIKAKVVNDRSKAFHSFRAGMATHLEQGGIPEATAVWILGHTRNLSLSYGLYSEGPSLKQLQQAVEKVPTL